MFSTPRGCLAVFSALRSCLGQILRLLGMLSCFDPTHCSKFRTSFWLGNEGIWAHVHKRCSCNCELVTTFESPKLDIYSSSYGPFHSRDCHNLGCLIVYVQNSGLVFGWETEEIWTRVLHRSCSCNCELDVRPLNRPN